MANEDLLKLTITELAPRIRAGEVSPVELTEAALARAERLQPQLNSFITILHEQARSQAREQEAAIARGEYLGPSAGHSHRDQGQSRNRGNSDHPGH